MTTDAANTARNTERAAALSRVIDGFIDGEVPHVLRPRHRPLVFARAMTECVSPQAVLLGRADEVLPGAMIVAVDAAGIWCDCRVGEIVATVDVGPVTLVRATAELGGPVPNPSGPFDHDLTDDEAVAVLDARLATDGDIRSVLAKLDDVVRALANLAVPTFAEATRNVAAIRGVIGDMVDDLPFDRSDTEEMRDALLRGNAAEAHAEALALANDGYGGVVQRHRLKRLGNPS